MKRRQSHSDSAFLAYSPTWSLTTVAEGISRNSATIAMSLDECLDESASITEIDEARRQRVNETSIALFSAPQRMFEQTTAAAFIEWKRKSTDGRSSLQRILGHSRYAPFCYLFAVRCAHIGVRYVDACLSGARSGPE